MAAAHASQQSSVSPVGQSNRTVVLSIELPEETYRVYQAHARTAGQTVEQTITARLKSCWAHDDCRALFFNDERRRELEKMMGRNFQSAGHVIDNLRKVYGIKLNGQLVYLKPDLLVKLQYAAGRHRKLEDCLQELIVRILTDYLGG